MAVDTELKRRSIMWLGHRRNIPPPDTSGVSSAERFMLVGLYSGLTPDAPSGGATGVKGILDSAIGGAFVMDSAISSAIAVDSAIGGALVIDWNIGGASK